MGLVKTVQLAVTGDIRDASAKIKELIGKKDELTAKPAELKVELTGTEKVKAQLDDIDAHAELLKKEFPEFTAKIDTATATSKVSVLRRDLQGIKKVAEDAGGGPNGPGLISRMLFGGGKSGGGGVTGALLPGPGPAAALTGFAAVGPALAGLAVEATGLASGFAAAGIGVGSFAALAIPALGKIKTAYTNINAAQKAYHAAVETEKLDPTKSNAAAVSRALIKLKESWTGLDPAERHAVHGVDDFRTSYDKMAKAFEPDVFKVFNHGLKIANDLLPTLKPFADRAATAIDGLLKKIQHVVKPPPSTTLTIGGKTVVNPSGGTLGGPGQQFQDFLSQMKQLEGPSITAIGQGLGNVTAALGQLLTVMSKKDVINAINIAFSILTGTIKGITFVVKEVMSHFDDWVNTFKTIIKFGNEGAHQFDIVRHSIFLFGNEGATVFDTLRHTVAHFTDDFVGFFRRIGQAYVDDQNNVLHWSSDINHDIGLVLNWFVKLPGEIGHALAGLGSLLFNIGKNAVQGLINGLLSLWHKLTSLVDHIKSIIGFGGGAGHKPGTPGGPAGGAPSANAAMARGMFPEWGSGANWDAWNYVAMRESGWNQFATNASSGAYGIPQALPPTKMPLAAQAAGGSNPASQISWMASYMRGRYGGPQGAAAHEQAFNWYDSGGMLPRGISMAVNNTGAPERVLSGSQERGIEALLRELIRAVHGSSAATGHAMARGLQGTARTAGARGMYSARGAWA